MIDVNINTYLTKVLNVEGISEVEQRIMLVLGTPKGSRWKRYNFGCWLEQHLFKPLNSDTASDIRREIEDAFIDPYNGLTDVRVSPVTVLPDIINQSYYVEFKAYQGEIEETLKFNLRRL
jgi:phage baseplate assembly protein W